MIIGSKEWKTQLREGAERIGCDISDDDAEKFSIHALELIHWNQKVNLTRITEPVDLLEKHFIDSIAPAPFILPGSALLDMGSGGGFPGIPLKVKYPGLSVLSVDASRKKISFQSHVIRILALKNIRAVHGRIEKLDISDSTGFDVIICRAFAPLKSILEKARSLLADKGKIIAMKGTLSEVEKELSGIEEMHPRLSWKIRKYRLPYSNAERNLVIFNHMKYGNKNNAPGISAGNFS